MMSIANICHDEYANNDLETPIDYVLIRENDNDEENCKG